MRATFGSKTAPLTRKQAERAIRNREPVEAASAAAVTGGRTFGDVLDEWLSHGRTIRGARWAPVTENTNRGMVEYRIKPVLGQIPLAGLTGAHLQNAYDSWTAEGLSDNSVHRLAALISSALSFAVIRDYVDASPAAKAVAPAATKSTKKIPDPADVAKLLTAAETYGKDMEKAITIAALTGARAGEVAALRWCDIDLKRGTIRIDKAATEIDGVVSIKGTKTGDERIARVEGNNLVFLRHALGTPGDPDTYVIDGKTEPINPGIISDRFVSVRGLAHIKNISFHQLRKFYATSLSEAGVPAKAIADIVGWKTTRMLDVYVGATKSGYDAAAAVELLPAQ
jgi:integrase